MISRKIQGLLQLFRPELPLAAGICVVIGQILASGNLPSWKVGTLGFLCTFCISSSALIFNDYFDYEVDKINAPNRPLPSGKVNPKDVILLGSIVSIIGLACSLVINLHAFLFAIFLWLVGFLYNWRYKQTGILGNLMVSTSVGGTFLFGAITTNAALTGVVWTFSLMAFFFDLGEEIAGDAMDMEGDRKRGSRSLALTLGRNFALRMTIFFWILFILLSNLPFLFGWLEIKFHIIFLLIDAIVIFFSVKLIQSTDADEGHKAMRGAYLGASVCLVAYLIVQLLA